MRRIKVYDTTLRDGAQSEGISFSCRDKLDLVRKLDAFGMDFIEGGWPGSSPRDDGFFSEAASLELENSSLVAFGSTCRYGTEPEDDANLAALSSCCAEWCCIFGKTWDLHIREALKISPEDNLSIIENSIRFLRDSGKRVMFDAEHFFDGYRSDPDLTAEAVRAAEKAGSEWIVLCDTNGGSLPGYVYESVKEISGKVSVPLGIHCHNDSDLAVACTLSAAEAGCGMVQGTVNGIGERCGNTNLCTLLPNLSIKMGMDLGKIDIRAVTELSKYAGEIANTVPDPNMPYVGSRAFAHKGGIHVSAIARNPSTYEHVPPESVGNARRILVSDMAGRASIAEKLKQLGMDSGGDKDIADTIKNL
ncbi:MAG: citramalate synthase, partial [Candidatus Methanomethylophilaceae archaeon]|nr:citramalate synthase [Candidatus Methanomethylophilaceae archaeon]